MGIFIDSGFFLGLINKLDPNHLDCYEKFKMISTGKYGMIYTSNLIISESATLIMIKSHNNSYANKAFKQLIYGNERFINILYSTHQITTLTWEIFESHNKNIKEKRKYLSFIDASNIAFCREFQIEYILATDSDFDNYIVRI